EMNCATGAVRRQLYSTSSCHTRTGYLVVLVRMHGYEGGAAASFVGQYFRSSTMITSIVSAQCTASLESAESNRGRLRATGSEVVTTVNVGLACCMTFQQVGPLQLLL